MNTLLSRVISALVAIASLVGSFLLFGKWGLFAVCSGVIFIALLEYRNVGFLRIKTPRSFQYLFLFTAVCLYILLAVSPYPDMMSASVCLAGFYALGLWLGKDKMVNVKLLTSLSIGTLGLVYCVIFPALAMKTLVAHDQGLPWFVALLVVVFFGDTGAYFGGKTFGRHKLMPEVSPKKTVEGAAIGALCSSLFGALYISSWLPGTSPSWAGLTCLVIGMVAQCGDLFVSLIKRVAGVKDSGKIMPGHGGFLDRLDGVFIASPLIFAASILLPQ